MAKKSYKELAYQDDIKKQTGKEYSKVTFRDLADLDDRYQDQIAYQKLQKRIYADYEGNYNSSTAALSKKNSSPDDDQWNKYLQDSIARNRQRAEDTINAYKDRYDTSVLGLSLIHI